MPSSAEDLQRAPQRSGSLQLNRQIIDLVIRIINGTTQGRSPKAIAALLWPLITALAASLVSWLISGDFNSTELRTSIGGAVLSVVAGIGAALSQTGTIISDEPPEIDYSEEEFEGEAPAGDVTKFEPETARPIA